MLLLNSVLGWIDTKGQLSDGFAEDVTESFLKEEKKGVAGAWGMFNLLTDLIPDYAMAHYYMGKGQVTDGIYSKGMEHLKIAAELDPDNGEVALALKQAKKDKKKRTLNTIGYIASVHNDLESTNSNSFKDESRNQKECKRSKSVSCKGRGFNKESKSENHRLEELLFHQNK